MDLTELVYSGLIFRLNLANNKKRPDNGPFKGLRLTPFDQNIL